MGSPPQHSKLFKPLKLGNAQLSNRIALAPLTRFRAEDDHVIMPLAEDYYERRACVKGTLLVTEATVISLRAGGYQNVPGIYTEEQINAWKSVTRKVHDKGSYIFMQLWALGCVADPNVKQAEDSGDVVSASAIPYQEGATVPRELQEEEVEQYIRDIEATQKIDPFIKAYSNASPILLAGGLKPDSARRAVDEEYKDNDVVIVFGRFFIPNPDLVYRIERGIPLTIHDRDTFYNVKSPTGYVGWKFSEEYKKEYQQ